MIFIILGSIPFIVYIKFISGNKKIFLTDIQIKTFFKIIITSILLLSAYLLLNNYESFNLRSVFFNSISILTGTGYVNSEYDSWGSFPITLFLALMFIGGCAGSTTCGIKIFRIQILYSFIATQLKKIIYPKGVFVIKYTDNNKIAVTITLKKVLICTSVKKIFLFPLIILMYAINGTLPKMMKIMEAISIGILSK